MRVTLGAQGTRAFAAAPLNGARNGGYGAALGRQARHHSAHDARMRQRGFGQGCGTWRLGRIGGGFAMDVI